MKEFRQALDSFLAGQIDLAALQRALSVSLAKEPHLAAALGAYLEALYRGNRITGEAYLALVQLTRAQADADKTRFRAPAGANVRAPTSGEPAARAPAPPSAPAADGDKTVFRTPKAAASPTGAGAPSGASAQSGASEPNAGAPDDKTRFRTPRPAAPEPTPSAAPADATRLRARAVPGTSEAAAVPSREAVPAGGTDSSWSPTTGSTGSHTGSTTGGTGTGSTWSDPNRWSGGRTVALAVGSIIK